MSNSNGKKWSYSSEETYGTRLELLTLDQQSRQLTVRRKKRKALRVDPHIVEETSTKPVRKS